MEVHAISVRSKQLKNVILSEITVTNPFTGDVSCSVGLWDTGATGSVITESLARKLDLKPTSKGVVRGVHGAKEVNMYYVKITLNNENVSLALQVSECSELSPDSSVGMLIGMDIINRGDFAITNYQGETVMTYRTPSVQKIDFVEGMKVGKPLVKDKPPGRNDPCPCGSGKKYKHCCCKK